MSRRKACHVCGKKMQEDDAIPCDGRCSHVFCSDCAPLALNEYQQCEECASLGEE